MNVWQTAETNSTLLSSEFQGILAQIVASTLKVQLKTSFDLK